MKWRPVWRGRDAKVCSSETVEKRMAREREGKMCGSEVKVACGGVEGEAGHAVWFVRVTASSMRPKKTLRYTLSGGEAKLV